MDNSDKLMLRHLHAAIAMHAILGSLRPVPAEISPEVQARIADASFAIADSMIEKGGPVA